MMTATAPWYRRQSIEAILRPTHLGAVMSPCGHHEVNAMASIFDIDG